MTFVLSIIAKPPDDYIPPTPTPTSLSSPGQLQAPVAAQPPVVPQANSSVISDGNTAIDDIVSMMTDAIANNQSQYIKQVSRAAYVRDIGLILSDLASKKAVPDIIQIIGHGSPGRLELGAYWTQIDRDPKLGYAILDSNPDSYGMLLNVIPASSKVFLLGCTVGSTAPSGYVASGKALIFDLEDMTGADVYAADNLVYPSLFTENFVYTGSLVTSNGRPANPAAIVLSSLGTNLVVQSPPDVPVPQLTRLSSAPALGFRGNVAPVDVPPIFNQYVVASPQPAKLLAMAELVFEAKNYNRVEAICCLRYLRADTPSGQTVYFEPPPPAGTTQSSGDARLSFTKGTMEALRSGAGGPVTM